MKLIIIIIMIIAVIYSVHDEDKKKRQKNVDDMRAARIDFAKDGNRRILDRMSEQNFIKYYGQDQLDLIKNNRDTKLVDLKQQ